MRQENIAKQRLQRKVERQLRRKHRLRKRSPRFAPVGRSGATAVVRKESKATQPIPSRPRRSSNLQLAAVLALFITGVLAFSIPACGGTQARPLSFREQSVEITSVPKDAVFYLNDIQGTPLVTTDPAGQILGAAAYHPFGAVRYQTGRHGDPWGFVSNEEDRGSALSDFHARPYRPELGIFESVDPQALLRPEKIIGQPSRAFPYAYAAGDPLGQVDKDGRDFKFSVEGSHITITVPVVFYGKVTQEDVKSMKTSFESVWNQSPHSYQFGSKGPEYEVQFKLEGVIAKEAYPAQPAPKKVNSITIVPGRYLDGPNGSKIGGVDCYFGVGCRTGSFPSERLRDKTVIAHELGHLMGLDHVDDISNIMYQTNDGPADKRVSKTQVTQIADRGMMQKPSKGSTYEHIFDTEPPHKDAPK